MQAQHGGGRSQPGPNSKPPLVCVHDCLERNTDLNPEQDRQLEHLMAVQATADQIAAFNRLLQDVESTRTRLHTFKVQPAPASSVPSDFAASLDQAIDKIRTGNQSFLTSLSDVQKSGLKDVTRKLETADSDLDKQKTTFDRTFAIPRVQSEPAASSAGNLDNALASFQAQQLALAREMSIVLPSDGQELHFPSVKTTIDLAGQSLSIPTSGWALLTSTSEGRDEFDLKMMGDLSDLQQNITGILRSQLARSPNCGERVEIQHALLQPLAPASVVVIHLHFERWICPGGASPMELASGDGTVEVKLSASFEPGTGVHLASEFGRVDAEGLLRESILSGSLGDLLREQVVAALLPATQKAADLKATLPPAAEQSATIRKAEFQDAGVGQLKLVLDGQLQLSDEQTKQFAAQMQKPIATAETSPR